MKKLITSAIAATALLFGFASCSNDLHDVENTPYTNSANAVYVIGGISEATVTGVSSMTKYNTDTGFKTDLSSEGKVSFTFTYSGEDSWSAGSGNQAFAVVADATGSWGDANAQRWMTSADGVAVGSEGTLSIGSANNVKITGLSAGTQYTVEMALTAAGGTIKVTEGLSAVPFELIAIDSNGNLTTASSITAKDSKNFTYEVTPAEKEQTLKYIARYGNTYFVPSASGSFTVDGTTQDAAATTTQPDSVASPLTVTIPTATVAEDDNVSSYTLTFTLDAEIASATKLTASVEKEYIMPFEELKYVQGTFNNGAADTISWTSKPTTSGSGKIDGKPYTSLKVYTGTYTISQSASDNWKDGVSGRTFGITGASDWSIKYTGADLYDAGTEYELTKGASANNCLKLQSLTSDIVLTIKYYVYEDTYSNGSFSDVTKATISYTGTGEKALE